VRQLNDCCQSNLPHQGPHILVQCTAVNIKFLLFKFKEGATNGFIRLAKVSSVTNTYTYCHSSTSENEGYILNAFFFPDDSEYMNYYYRLPPVTWVQIWWMRPQSPACHSVTQDTLWTMQRIVCGVFLHWLKNCIGSLVHMFKTFGWNACNLSDSEKNGPNNPSCTHSTPHNPTLTLCNG
jgi:hypothetical protein